MELAMPVVWSDRCLLHDPGREIWVGLPTEATEVPARVDRILDTLARPDLLLAQAHDDEILKTVHDEGLLRYLQSAWQEWQASGLPEDPGQTRVVAYIFAHPGLGAPLVEPTAVWAKPGFFAYDTMTLVGEGTWEAARAAVDVALTAADLVREGEPVVYACTRPPGHHACYAAYGGSCYLNNAACAAVALGLGRVAVLDIDAHQCNGTQQIFAGNSDVIVGSVHVDPRAGWFPHFLGFAHGLGAKNIPLAPGTADEEWLEAIRSLAKWARETRAQGLVVSLGVDAAAGDPESPLEVTQDGYRDRPGRRLRRRDDRAARAGDAARLRGSRMNSGGQRQRVAIAASIVLQPDLLVADEPVSMLDVSVRAGILKLLDRLREGGLGILMITHDLSTAARFADRIAVMYLGRIVEEGPAQAVVRDPQTRTRRRCYRSSRGATRKSARGARSSAARLPTRSGSRPGAGFTHGVQSPSKTAAESTPL